MTTEQDTSGIEVETNSPEQVAPEPKAKVEAPVEDDEGPDSSDDEGVEKKKSRRARQIERLRLDNEALARELAAERAKQSKPVAENQPQQTKSDQPPKIEDFTDVLDFIDAKAEYIADKKLNGYKTEIEERELARTKEAEALEYGKLTQAYEEKIATIIPDNPDFPQKVQAYINAGLVTEPVEKAVLRSEMPEQVALHLTKFPGDMLELSKITDPNQARIAIQKIEDFILDNQESSQGKVTQASAPITPIGKKAATSTKDPSKSDDMSDWYAYEAKMSPRNK